MTTAPRLLAVGDSAWTLEFGSRIEPQIHERVMGLAQRLAQERAAGTGLPGVTDVVPTFRSLTVHFDPWTADAAALGRQLQSLAQEGHRSEVQGHHWRLPVCLDEDFAPDLPRVAEVTGLGREAVVQALLAATFRVYLIGFQPGFPYMGGLPASLNVPRLASPRQKVPAQSVAIALDMCAVYPWESPGGWNLLGRTPVALFDPRQDAQPAMLAAGDEVRWVAVDRAEHDRLAAEIACGLPRSHFLDGGAL